MGEMNQGGGALPGLDKKKGCDFYRSLIPTSCKDRGAKTISTEKWNQVKLRKIEENLKFTDF